MISPEKIQAILMQYEKHGWNLRRVLLSAPETNFPPALFGEAEIVASEMNAVWFSRAAAEGHEAWELRNLSDAPFALIEVFESEDEEEVREEIRQEMQTRMAEQASKFINKRVAS